MVVMKVDAALPTPQLVKSGQYVVNRRGERQIVDIGKVQKRLEPLTRDMDQVDLTQLLSKVVAQIKPGTKTAHLDQVALDFCSSMIARHPQWETLSTRIAVTSLHKDTPGTVAEYCDALEAGDTMFAPDKIALFRKHAEYFDSFVDHEKDLTRYRWMGIKMLLKSYLIRGGKDKQNSRVIERIQYMLLRVAVQLHGEDLHMVRKTYEFLSDGCYSHGSPTLFNSCCKVPQLSSCFTLRSGDSVDDFMDALKIVGVVSGQSGGLGLDFNAMRSAHSLISSTGGHTNGILDWMQMVQAVTKGIDQGGGKRPGSCAVYLSPDHPDFVTQFLPMRRPTTPEESQCMHLHNGVWMPDLFMERVERDEIWTFLNPVDYPGLDACFGEEYKVKYHLYENAYLQRCAEEGVAPYRMRAKDIFKDIIKTQMQTGRPYIVSKDRSNENNMQDNVGPVFQSNLCTEILQHTSKEYMTVCNLSSINLTRCVNLETKTFDFDFFAEIVALATANLNRVIDTTAYPLDRISNVGHPDRKANMELRSIGLGVQGLSNVYQLLDMPHTSPEARELNRSIFEHLYYHAALTSCGLAERDGPYPKYEGSWVQNNNGLTHPFRYCKGKKPEGAKLNWDDLHMRIQVHGLRNSLFVAPMPTKSTARLLGNVEAFEPIESHMIVQQSGVGETVVFNQILVDRLTARGQWTDAVRNMLIRDNGSVQNFPDHILSAHEKDVFKTVWELSVGDLIEMAADRQPYVDQSQSFNLFIKDVTVKKLYSAHLKSWRAGLKTLCYYIHMSAAREAVSYAVKGNDTNGGVGDSAPTSASSSSNNSPIPAFCTRESSCESCHS